MNEQLVSLPHVDNLRCAHNRFVTNTAVYPLFDAIRVISSEGISSYFAESCI